jgi:prepilin-type N-terminal cleavage/methylation domain-containing protein
MKSTPARAGVTLVELLVVMLIIATLASLVLSAVITVRDAQMKSFTESLVNKLASAVEQQWNAAADQIREEPVPNWALSMGNGDPRIAKVIYLKARLKQEFPVSFYQAIYPNANYTPGQPGAYQTLGGMADLPPKATYLKALGPLVPSFIPNMGQGIPQLDLPMGMPAGFESSALLYLSLSQGRRGQTGFNPDENIEATAIQTRTVGGVTFKIFVDSWGNPIRFWACPYGNDELNAAPYLQNTFTQNQQSPDVQDPDQALAGFQSAAFAKMVHPLGTQLRNLIPVVGSIGRDGLSGVDPFDMSNPTADPSANDNIYSYHLRRYGQRGD